MAKKPSFDIEKVKTFKTPYYKDKEGTYRLNGSNIKATSVSKKGRPFFADHPVVQMLNKCFGENGQPPPDNGLNRNKLTDVQAKQFDMAQYASKLSECNGAWNNNDFKKDCIKYQIQLAKNAKQGSKSGVEIIPNTVFLLTNDLQPRSECTKFAQFPKADIVRNVNNDFRTTDFKQYKQGDIYDKKAYDLIDKMIETKEAPQFRDIRQHAEKSKATHLIAPDPSIFAPPKGPLRDYYYKKRDLAMKQSFKGSNVEIYSKKDIVSFAEELHSHNKKHNTKLKLIALINADELNNNRGGGVCRGNVEPCEENCTLSTGGLTNLANPKIRQKIHDTIKSKKVVAKTSVIWARRVPKHSKKNNHQ